MNCFIPNTSESPVYHAIDSLPGGMSRMGTTPTIAFLALAVASLVAMPHASAAVTVRDLGTLPGYTWSEALGINAAGQIVGTSGDMESQSRPFLWDDGVMTNLGTLGGTRGTAHDISNTGLIVGESEDATHTMRAFVWENGAMTDLGPGVAFAVNDAGQAVGCGYPTSPSPPCHAVLWQAGQMTDLGTLGGRSGSAYGINSAGQIVGSSLAPDPVAGWRDDGTPDPRRFRRPGLRHQRGPSGGRRPIPLRTRRDGRGTAGGHGVLCCRHRAGRGDLRVLSSAPELPTAQEPKPKVRPKPNPASVPGRATSGICTRTDPRRRPLFR